MFTRAGYNFGSWNTQADGKGTTYAEGSQITSLQNNVTLYAQWIANSDTSYVVETYLEGEDGNYPEDPNTSITRTATTDTTVSVTDADKQAPEGYALDPNADNVFEGTVAGDGSLVLKLYFAKDVIGPDPENPGDEIPDKYQILFTYKAKENGVVTGETYELHTFKDNEGNYVEPTATTPDAEVKATANAGYHIDKWIDESSTDLGNGTATEFDNTTYTTNQTFTVSFAE
ncbi:Listeria-Bacteroides repeat domain (List_Bact_rpt) [Faecalitalea cylindroides T2-87]|uniref:Listeria-Bacteroides repeat domain (List_Bact_rpt) n=1 Tax=Faecalitalea cylindroides T2-87 TaxID=717960 RepID=D4JCX6_9FIRM|nr:Listeria-Bacteroides repeat domain (List_Bact_rpt) [Faecalitalea cylindroides T2-87]